MIDEQQQNQVWFNTKDNLGRNHSFRIFLLPEKRSYWTTICAKSTSAPALLQSNRMATTSAWQPGTYIGKQF